MSLLLILNVLHPRQGTIDFEYALPSINRGIVDILLERWTVPMQSKSEMVERF